MTPEQLGFIAAITTAPDDDLPRLAYADWLQDRGEDARAEFIRLQARIPREPAHKPARGEIVTTAGGLLMIAAEDVPNADLPKLRLQSAALLGIHGKDWLGLSHDEWVSTAGADHLHVWPVGDNSGRPLAQFDRGFATHIICPAEFWVRCGDGLREREPMLQIERPAPDFRAAPIAVG